MKLLVCAYDCKPGSEPGVGWNWVQAYLRLGYQVHVITSGRHRGAIMRNAAALSPTLVFHHCDVPVWARGWDRSETGWYFYHLMWQWVAYDFARELHGLEKFDRVHHISPGSLHQPSFMGGLGIPFVFGPVGGGESAPAELMRGMSLRGRLELGFRRFRAALLNCDPFMRTTFRQAETIACTTAETMNRIPKAYRSRCIVQTASGIDEHQIAPAPLYDNAAPNFAFLGKLKYGNGLHLAIEALAEARRTVPLAKLRVIGEGPEREWLEQRARQMGVWSAVEWLGAARPEERLRVLRDSVALVSPSMCDGSGKPILEALASALPVICLDLGVPGSLATPDCACIVRTDGAREGDVVKSLATAMILLATNPQLRTRMGASALNRARQLTWDSAAQAVNRVVEPIRPAA